MPEEPQPKTIRQMLVGSVLYGFQSFFFAGFFSLLSLAADSFASDAFAAESLLSFDSDFVAGALSLPALFFRRNQSHTSPYL